MKCATLLALSWALLAAGPARAGTPELRDRDYALHSPARQAEPPQVPGNPLLAPSTSAPALVAWGEEFTVRLALPPGVSPGQAEQWRVVLNTRTRGPFGEMVGDVLAAHYPCLVEQVHPVAGGRQAELRVRAPAAAPRDSYHLEVAGPGGLVARRVYAVRLVGDASRFEHLRLVAIADSQLRDPTTELNGAALNSGAWPRCCEDAAESMFAQQVREIAFWDPDLVLYPGDLVFGVDYREEYRQTLRHWWSRPLATWFLPGNHDGMALYRLALRKRWWEQAARSLRCAVPLLGGDVDAAKVFAVLRCALGDLKKILFEDLAQDGLDYFRAILGPADMALPLGRLELIGLNSYAGRPERRHAFVLGLDFLGIDLGAAAVDNYGGYLTDAQLDWLSDRLRRAAGAGRRVVLLLHHDPRGTRGQPWGRGYHANLPFPTEPLGLRTFQEWNYDSSEWDSNPQDDRRGESQTSNSAVRLLELIARYVDVVVTGHIHDDEDTLIEPGAELVPGSGIRARRRIHIIRLATSASSPDDEDGYWGYRLLQFAAGRLQSARYRPDFGWASIPSGNLWITGEGVVPGFGRNLVGQFLYAVHNGLPQTARGRLRAWLPAYPQGIRLRSSGPGHVALVDSGRAVSGYRLYYFRVEVPGVRAGSFPVAPGDEQVLRLEWEWARHNRVPQPYFQLVRRVAPGREVVFDASASRDPDGGRLVQYLWNFGDGHDARGVKVSHAYRHPGNYPVSLTVIDDCGARGRFSTTLEVVSPTVCAAGRGACVAGCLALPLLAMALLLVWQRRRRVRG